MEIVYLLLGQLDFQVLIPVPTKALPREVQLRCRAHGLLRAAPRCHPASLSRDYPPCEPGAGRAQKSHVSTCLCVTHKSHIILFP